LFLISKALFQKTAALGSSQGDMVNEELCANSLGVLVCRVLLFGWLFSSS